MFKVVKMGDKEIPMKATAATPLRYRHIFKKDVLTELSVVGENYGLAIDTVQRLAFVMAKCADNADMTKLNEEMYADWLDQFETFDIMDSIDAIIDLYLGNTETMSEAKKKVKGAVKGK